jgi:hypothetical protein
MIIRLILNLKSEIKHTFYTIVVQKGNFSEFSSSQPEIEAVNSLI